MAKEAGDNRCSTWAGDPYAINGIRKEYGDLPDDRKQLIKQLKKRVSDLMWENLKDKSVRQTADGKEIDIQFDRTGVKHVANDALLTLSGKYMSRESMIHIDRILAESTYIPTLHELSHGRTDSRRMWFKYQDSQGRGIYFSVAHSPDGQKKFTLYSVSDVPPE